jgi:HD-like signal output (HDOD) protein
MIARPDVGESGIWSSVIALTIGILVVLLACVAAFFYRSRRRSVPIESRRLPSRSSDVPAGEATQPGADEPIPFATEATTAALDECYKLAFGVGRFDYQIMGDHAVVLASVAEAADSSVHERDYFPRRPMLLPKLLQALNDDASTRQEFVRLILEDPSLAGNVLVRANSAWYRTSPEPVESLDRAVRMLGTDGLKSLLATAILQPVFRLPKGYFDAFAPITWEQAQRVAAAAEAYAKSAGGVDPFVAQLLGVIAAMSRIVLFRLTMDTYREHPNLLPRAEVFIRSMQAHSHRIAGLVAQTWELSDASVRALTQQAHQLPPAEMSEAGRAVYYGDLCGALALLHERGAYSVDGAQAMLMQQGAPRTTVHAMWHAAVAAGKDS